MPEKNRPKPEWVQFANNRVDALLGRFALDIAKERITELTQGKEYPPDSDKANRLAQKIVKAFNENGKITVKEICRFLELSGDGLSLEIKFTNKETQVYFADDDLLKQ